MARATCSALVGGQEWEMTGQRGGMTQARVLTNLKYLQYWRSLLGLCFGALAHSSIMAKKILSYAQSKFGRTENRIRIPISFSRTFSSQVCFFPTPSVATSYVIFGLVSLSSARTSYSHSRQSLAHREGRSGNTPPTSDSWPSGSPGAAGIGRDPGARPHGDVTAELAVWACRGLPRCSQWERGARRSAANGSAGRVAAARWRRGCAGGPGCARGGGDCEWRAARGAGRARDPRRRLPPQWFHPLEPRPGSPPSPLVVRGAAGPGPRGRRSGAANVGMGVDFLL